jgi:hypothetical protein
MILQSFDWVSSNETTHKNKREKKIETIEEKIGVFDLEAQIK